MTSALAKPSSLDRYSLSIFLAHLLGMALDLGLVHRHALDGRDVDGVRDVQFGVQLAGGIQGETERMVGCFAEVGAEDDVREQVPAGGAGAVDDEHRAGAFFATARTVLPTMERIRAALGIAIGAARAHDDEIGPIWRA